MLDCRKGKCINLGVLCDNINFSLLMLIAILEETFLHVATVLYSLMDSIVSLSIKTFEEILFIFCLHPISLEVDFVAFTTSLLHFSQERVSSIQICTLDSTSVKKEQKHKG